jgi:S-adenosylmethionine:tRNA ribosyltransferase-isomerase
MLLSELDYALPEDRIAQYPPQERGTSRMLLLERGTGQWQDRSFGDLPGLLNGDELLVVNNARVIPARLFGRRVGIHTSPPSRKTRSEHLTGEIEILLTRRVEGDTWEALVHPGRKIKTGEGLRFGKGELEAEVLARGEFGLRRLKFSSQDAAPVTAHLERLGHVPLPPYIKRQDEESDRERYQTIFASRPGAVAAPTAGLHFTPAIREAIRRKGAEICELTLDVGLGTFQPIRSATLEGHQLHAEAYDVPLETAQRVEAARRTHRPILAVGTTVVRALEDAALRAKDSSSGMAVASGRSEAGVFITPGFRFRAVDALLTNFHLPRSTLLAMVCAFAGREHVLAAYHHAVEAGYRFYSYGDCMLIR